MYASISVLRQIPGVRKRSWKEAFDKFGSQLVTLSMFSTYGREFVSAAFFTTASASLIKPFAESHLGDSGKNPGMQRGKIINKIGHVIASCRLVHFGKIQEIKGTHIKPSEGLTPKKTETHVTHFPPTISMQ